MWTKKHLGIIALAVVIAGCGEDKIDEPLAQNEAQPIITSNTSLDLHGINLRGFILQTMNLNGVNLQGINLQDINLQNIKLQGSNLEGLELQRINLQGLNLPGVDLEGVTLNFIALDGSLLKGLLSNGRVISGKDFIGLVIKVSVGLANPTPYTIRIAHVFLDQQNQFPDVWMYRINIKGGSYQELTSICTDHAGNEGPLVPLMGMHWNEYTGDRIDQPNALTLACDDGVIKRCMHLGYRPWAMATQCMQGDNNNCTTISLKDHHQACTRMLRADYCGNGKPWTKDGTLIDIFDYLTPLIQLRETDWEVDSRWVAGGAICVSRERNPELNFPGYCVKDGQQVNVPKCKPYEVNLGLTTSAFDPM